MNKADKPFDCVEMKRAAAKRIHETLQDMTREERIAYWQQRNEEVRRRFPRMRQVQDASRK